MRHIQMISTTYSQPDIVSIMRSTIKSLVILDSLLYSAFFLSGFSALIYQVAFERVLVRIIGATVPAVSILFCLFMCGLAIGSFACGKIADRLHSPLRVYALLEMSLAIWAFAFILMTQDSSIQQILSVSSIDSLGAGDSTLLNWLIIYGLVSALLLIPTTIMGAILPLIGRHFALVGDSSFSGALVSDHNISPSHNLSKTYTINIAGAALGTITGGFFLLPQLGLTLTILLGAAVNIFVTLVIFLVDFVTSKISCRSVLKSTSEPVLEKEPEALSSGRRISRDHPHELQIFPILLAVFVGAFLSMMLEVVYTRLFSLILGSSTYSMSCVVAVFLVGLAFGAYLANRIGLRLKTSILSAAHLFFAFALIIWASLWLIHELPWVLAASQINMAKLMGNFSFSVYLISRILVVALITLLPGVLLGTIFPLSVYSFVRRKENAGKTIAQLSIISALGSALGALSTGYILLPWLGVTFVSGMQAALVGAAIIAMLTGAILMVSCHLANKKHVLLTTSMLVLACVLYIGVFPVWDTTTMSSGVSFLALPEKVALNRHSFYRKLQDQLNCPAAGNELVFYREGANTTVTVGRLAGLNITYLKNDGKIEAAIPTDPNRPSVNSDLPTQVLLGLLPVILCPDAPANVFVVGYGSGATCGAILASPEVKKLVVAELEKAVYDAAVYFSHSNNRPLQQKDKGRVVALIADARNVLAMTDKQFQAIVSQPAEPWIAGSSHLYTKQFWLLAKSRLTQRGVFCQWIQLYAIDPQYLAVVLRTFQSVFPSSFIFHSAGAGEIIIVGFNHYELERRRNNDNFRSLTDLLAPANGPLDLVRIQDRIKFPQIRQFLRRIGVSTGQDSVQMTMLLPQVIDVFCRKMALKYHDERLNTDDLSLTEFALPKNLFQPEVSIGENLKELMAGQGTDKRKLLIEDICSPHNNDSGWPKVSTHEL